eukprot:3265161-Rhodomonas_salina.1
MLDHRLAALGRTLDPAQRKAVLQAAAARKAAGADDAGTPLWVQVASQLASQWRSSDPVPAALGKSVKDLFHGVLDRLAAKFGTKLVPAAVAYLSLAATGLAEMELSQLLSLNKEALADACRLCKSVPLSPTVSHFLQNPGPVPLCHPPHLSPCSIVCLSYDRVPSQ